MNTGIKNAIEYETWKLQQNEDMKNLKSDQIDSLIVEKGTARLYNQDALTYGELETVDDSGSKKTFFYVLSSLTLEMYERNSLETEHTSIEKSRGKIMDDKRKF